jgi:hypothetical protein
MTRPMTLLLTLIALATAAVGCGKGDDAGGSALYKQENTPDNLKGLLDAIVKAQESGDLPTAAALNKSLIVDEDTLKKFFKDGVPDAFLKQQVERLKRYPTVEAELANLIRRTNPLRTKTLVHGATTEEILANETAAAKEFEAVPRDFAAQLRPATTFYQAEFVEPDKEAGRKHHLFLWDGSRWRMLGPNWR